MSRHLHRLVPLVALTVILAACGGDGDNDARSTSPSTTTQPGRISAVVDWQARTVEVRGETPFQVAFCEGEAPFLCVSKGGVIIGSVERGMFGAVDDLGAWAAEHYETVAHDRAEGCDPEYELAGDELVDAELAGQDGARFGFTGTIDGRVVERVIGVAAVVDGRLDLLVANALSEDSCLAREGELPVDVMGDFEALLRALAAGSVNGPDSPDAFAEGTFTGFLMSIAADGGIEIDPAQMLSGDDAVEAAREDGELPPDGQLPNDFYIDDDEEDMIVGLLLDDDAVVELYDCSAECALRQVATEDFLSGSVEAYGGERPLVEVEVEQGVVLALREIYVP